MKAAKEEEIAAGQAQIDTKTQELADTDEKNAQAKEDIADTKKSLGADEEFLMMLKEKCSMTDGEWEERQKTRQLEMEACSKALAVLSSDDAYSKPTPSRKGEVCSHEDFWEDTPGVSLCTFQGPFNSHQSGISPNQQ